MSNEQLSKLSAKLRESLGGAVSFSDQESKFPVAVVEAGNLVKVMRFCVEERELAFNFLENITAVDYDGKISVIYQIHSTTLKHRLNVECTLSGSSRKLPSVSEFWRAAISFEAEIQELFGVEVKDPTEALRGLFLPEGWDGYPMLRKYKYPQSFNGISHERVNIKKNHRRSGGEA